ncbi:MAG: single-stranded DNA-binding protein [candidate division Zixibacteria bacterium]|jgi:single-strand DNA-binding protein|nr:single-stranded DNA-binding protein [candidate division Zixibacteria bacterium]
MSNTRLPHLNRVLIVGNLTKDPELRYTSTGVPVANFRIASNKKYKDNLGESKEDVCFIGVVAWQKLAESCSKFLKKGSAVLVEGELRSRFKENDDGSKRNLIEIRAFQVQFLDKKTEAVPVEETSLFDLKFSGEENISDLRSSIENL